MQAEAYGLILASMKREVTNIEPGRPARTGQLILDRRYRTVIRCLGDKIIGTMLDIGCGNGAQTRLFVPDADRLIGYDLFSIQDAEGYNQSDTFDFVRGNAQILPFSDSVFDTVTSFEVLEHVPDDAVVLREMFRVLKPKGFLFLTVPNRWWFFESHGANIPGFNWVPWNRVPFISWLPTALHDKIAQARIYTVKQASTLLEKAGFNVLESGFITAPLDVLPNGSIQRYLRRTIFRRDTTAISCLAVNLYIAAEKTG